MPDVLEQFGLKPALEDLIHSLKDTTQIIMSLEMVDMDIRLAPQIEKGLFRLSQELINNSMRHSSARHILFRLLIMGSL